MSSSSGSSTTGLAGPTDTGDLRAGRRRVIVALVVALVAASVLTALKGVFDGAGPRARSDDAGSATSLATVTRRTLSQSIQLNGVLGYAGSYDVLGQRPGTVTWLPKVGQVIDQGQVIYEVDGAPVVLLRGPTPAYRDLAAGATTAARTGDDVAQLNHDLVALGYADAADVQGTWREFNWATKAAVERLQDHLGVEQTGRLALGDVVFLPTTARVTARAATLGAPATGPVLQASSTVPRVTLALDASLQAEVRTGDRVRLTLPDGTTAPGRVTSVGTVATAGPSGSDGSGGSGGSDDRPTVAVQIRMVGHGTAGGLDHALVEVTIKDQTVRDALAVPVTALLARADGGYAVEVVAGNRTHHLVPVQPGMFDDAAGLVQVSGPGLVAGQHVVVPGDE